MTTTNDYIPSELAQTIGAALELAVAGKPYAEVIRHLGEIPPHHYEYLMSGEKESTLSPASPLFEEIHFSLMRPERFPRHAS